MRFEATPTVAAPALSTMTVEELKTVAWLAAAVRRDIRKKVISLRSLRAISADQPLYNPYHSTIRNITPGIWARVMVCVGGRVNDTCTSLVELEQRADLAIEVATTKVEPARDITGIGHEALAEAMDAEAADENSTRPTARGWLVSLIKRNIAAYLKHDHKFEEATAMYHLDNCRSYGVINMSAYTKIYNHLRETGSMAGNYSAERNHNVLIALCQALEKGGNIEEAVRRVTQIS